MFSDWVTYINYWAHYSFLISALSESLQVWRASAEKITFVSSEGVESGAEVFNNYGDKMLGESDDPWVGGCHGICSWDLFVAMGINEIQS